MARKHKPKPRKISRPLPPPSPEIEATAERLAHAGSPQNYGLEKAIIEKATDRTMLCRRFKDSYADRQRGNGRFTQAQYAAAEWYRERYEEAGLGGRLVANYGATSGAGEASYGMPTSERQARARQAWRKGRALIPSHMLASVDRVILHDEVPGFRNGQQRARHTASIAAALQPLADWLHPADTT